ncbi:MAG TPA: type II secretion system protein [Gemmatimonadaceae bacterium]|nr:type II secretion system protein [Gemmatimonadaceae bacterium]
MLNSNDQSPRAGVIRGGFTLVEMLIVIVLLSLVLTSVMTIFVQQQRFYSDTSAIMQTRSSTRDAAYVLQSDLRSISPGDTDIYSMGSNFIEFRSQLGTSVVCTIDGTRKVLTVPPVNVAAETALTSWLSAPISGDTLLIFDPGPLSGPADDSWRVYTLTALPASAATCPNSTGLTTTIGEATQGMTFHVTPALTVTTPVGAPIRLMRRARYQLYQEGSGNWYLGYFDCSPSRTPVCTTLQPVAGPYIPPGATGGIVFTFSDATGAVTADPKLVRRIDLTARAQTAVDIHTSGFKRGAMTDSTFSTIAPRN